MHSTMTFGVVIGCHGLKSKVRTRVEKFCSNNDGILRHYSNISQYSSIYTVYLLIINTLPYIHTEKREPIQCQRRRTRKKKERFLASRELEDDVNRRKREDKNMC